MRKLWWTSGIAAGVLAIVAVAWGYSWYTTHYPTTEDAYVQANVVKVAAEVSGRVVEVPVSDQEFVAEGRTLFRLERRPFELAVQRAEARLELARQEVASRRAAVNAAEAEVAEREARLAQARRHAGRMRRLREQGSASQAELDDAEAELASARAALDLARARLQEAKSRLGEDGAGDDRIREARAALEQARLDLSHTSVEAPCRGKVSNLSLQAGSMVQGGKPQFALVCDDKYWVYANYKETDLGRIRPGQDVEIHLDMYPGHTFHGVVQNIDAASGAAFSLLPPQNASGNWVKVTRRVPVRILVTDPDQDFPLRVQTSAEVTIDTGSGEEPAGRAFREMRRTGERTLAAEDGASSGTP